LGSRPLAASKTVDDLEQEYLRWTRGEMDEHDRVLEAHKRAAMERDQQEQVAAQRELEAEVQAEQEEPDELVVRSPAEVEMMPQRRATFVPDVKVAAGRAYWRRRQEQGKGMM
jgi:hypothetical protein